jgi:hypothetical protein
VVSEAKMTGQYEMKSTEREEKNVIKIVGKRFSNLQHIWIQIKLHLGD